MLSRLSCRAARPSPRLSRSSNCQATQGTVSSMQRVAIKAVPITEEAFKQFGQLIAPTDDGKLFDGQDAQLVLDQGTPRFYIMRLPKRGRTFTRITYHGKVTQCLGCLQPGHWYMVVSPPSGSVDAHPTVDNITAFRIPHGSFVKLHQGTWHAGPLFDDEFQDFYNLELADTNVVDHNTYDFTTDGVEITIEDDQL